MDRNDVRLCKSYLSRKLKIIFAAVFLVIGIVALFIGTFIRNGGPIGLPTAAISFIIAVVLFSRRVSDEEFDKTAGKYVSHRNNQPSIAAFDLKDKHTVRGKDGKLRSSKFFYTTFDPDGEDLKILVQYADLLSGTTMTKEYSVKKSDVQLKRVEIKVAGAVKKCPYLVCEAFFADIPVDLTSFESSKLIEDLFSTNL